MLRRVLITRSAERSQELVDALRRENIAAIAEPVTETLRIADAASLPDLTRIDWITFTSANAVTAFVEILRESGRILPADVRLAAIGPATAKLVCQELRVLDIISNAANGVDLAHTLFESAGSDKDFTVLWPCAEDSLPDFSNELSMAGVDVIEWPIYLTKPVAPWILNVRLERPSSFAVAVFAAPSAVKSLHEAWPEPWPFICVAIGPTTAAAVRKTGATEVLTSKSPRPADILSTILDALRIKNFSSLSLSISPVSTNGGSH